MTESYRRLLALSSVTKIELHWCEIHLVFGISSHVITSSTVLKYFV